jgi:hypothetical protein
MRQMIQRGMREWRRAVGGLRWRPAVVVMAAGLLGGCSLDSLLKSDQLPPDVTDPAYTESLAGAMTAYRGVLLQFRRGYDGSVVMAGILGDEMAPSSPTFAAVPSSYVDRREIQEGVSIDIYGQLQKARGDAAQAIGLLRDYAPESHRPLIAHVYALAGYAELHLAELFCSGIPLSTLDYKGDNTLRPGSSTADVYRHAIALFDTALVLAGDSTRFLDLARVGKARALLGLGEPAQAAAVVAEVPDGFQYLVQFGDTANSTNFARVYSGVAWENTVSDREGFNGLDYRTSGDPRTATTLRPGYTTWPVYHPNKYSDNGASPIVLASGVEARLIEAEAALQAGGADWLAMLNALRTDGTFDTRPDSLDPAQTDTLWHAGTGGVARLGPLDDPGTLEGRIDLLFRERAFWLFLTGHRQGDMRRLIRQYGRDSEQVYPTGQWLTGRYARDVTLPIPEDERLYNPQFTGCIDRGA